MCVLVKGQPTGVSSLLLPCGSQNELQLSGSEVSIFIHWTPHWPSVSFSAPLSYLFLENCPILVDGPVFPGPENDLRLLNWPGMNQKGAERKRDGGDLRKEK